MYPHADHPVRRGTGRPLQLTGRRAERRSHAPPKVGAGPRASETSSRIEDSQSAHVQARSSMIIRHWSTTCLPSRQTSRTHSADICEDRRNHGCDCLCRVRSHWGSSGKGSASPFFAPSGPSQREHEPRWHRSWLIPAQVAGGLSTPDLGPTRANRTVAARRATSVIPKKRILPFTPNT